MATNYVANTVLTAKNLTGPAFARLTRSAQMAGAAVDRVKGGLTLAAGAAGALAGVWALTAGAAVRMTAEVSAQVAALDDLSNATGVSADALHRLLSVGEMQGADPAALSKGVKRLALDMADYKDATSSQYKALSQLNPALAKQLATAKNTDEALGLVTGAMLDATEAQRLQIAEQVFGKMAADDYALALGMTRKEMDKLVATMDKYNPPPTDKQVADLAALDDTILSTRMAWQTAQRGFAAGLAPGLKTALDNLNSWLVANRTTVEAWGKSLGEWIAGVDWDRVASTIERVASASASLASVLGGIASGFLSVTESVGGADNALKGLLATYAAYKAAQIVKGVGGATAAAGATAGATFGSFAKGVGKFALKRVMPVLSMFQAAKYATEKYGGDFDKSSLEGAIASAQQTRTNGANSRRGRGLYVRAAREGIDVGQGYIREQMQRQGIDPAAIGNAVGAAVKQNTEGSLNITVKVEGVGLSVVGTGVTKGAAVVGNVGFTGVAASSGGAF